MGSPLPGEGLAPPLASPRLWAAGHPCSGSEGAPSWSSPQHPFPTSWKKKKCKAESLRAKFNCPSRNPSLSHPRSCPGLLPPSQASAPFSHPAPSPQRPAPSPQPPAPSAQHLALELVRSKGVVATGSLSLDWPRFSNGQVPLGIHHTCGFLCALPFYWGAV